MSHFVGDGCFPDGHRSEPGIAPSLRAEPAAALSAEEIIADTIAAEEGPPEWAAARASEIVAELERYGFVIVNPSRTAAEPIAAAYEGKGPLRIVKAAGSVLRATGEVE